MSRIIQGGTKKYCPNCKAIRVCAAVNPSQLGYKSGQRLYKTQHRDIKWFRRGLVCQDCQNQWLTAEVDESFLAELVELRDALGEIKSNAESYIKQSKQAAQQLTKLSKSLGVLQALKIYRKK